MKRKNDEEAKTKKKERTIKRMNERNRDRKS